MGKPNANFLVVVFPTCVGVDRKAAAGRRKAARIPHVRGGGPDRYTPFLFHIAYSPRAWGWTVTQEAVYLDLTVFPTCVGVDRDPARVHRCERRIPHVRGGGPGTRLAVQQMREYSPRAWGWTVGPTGRHQASAVFPTCVGVDRCLSCPQPKHTSIPHVRGGGPTPTGLISTPIMYSPRAWGWTASSGDRDAAKRVFPTCVGVDRPGFVNPFRGLRIPHVRGGGPPADMTDEEWGLYSPRAWGWTVPVATSIGANLCIPHVRGGGPLWPRASSFSASYSPRAWGWTEDRMKLTRATRVFPTCVGVDRISFSSTSRMHRIPHVRGGGPPACLPLE